jgi:hypothetical protein
VGGTLINQILESAVAIENEKILDWMFCYIQKVCLIKKINANWKKRSWILMELHIL